MAQLRPQDRPYILINMLLWCVAFVLVFVNASWAGPAWLLAVSASTAYGIYARRRTASDPYLPLTILINWVLVGLCGVAAYYTWTQSETIAGWGSPATPETILFIHYMLTALFITLIPVCWHLAKTKIALTLGSKKIKGRKASEIFS